MIWRGLGQLQIRKFEDALLSFERGYQNNPTGGIFIGIALAYVLLGKDQELNTLYERDQYTKQYSKIFPMIYKVKNLMFFYPELKDDKLFAENFVKTGLCGDSDKYYKILKDQKLTSKEIEKLLLDRHISGYDFWTNKQWSLNGKDEEGIIFQYSKVTDHIKVWVEDDMFCRQWNILFGGLKDCAYVYKNLEGDVENKDEYILATDYGFYGFSVVE